MGFLGDLFGRGKKDAQQKTTTSLPMASITEPVVRGRDIPSPTALHPDRNGILHKIQQLEERRVLLEKRINQLDREIELDVAEAKSFLSKNQRPRAEMVLKRKKLKETERANKINFMLRLDTDIESIKGMAGQAEDVEAMRVMRDAAADIMKQVDPDKVARIQEDIEDARDQMRDLSDILYAAPISEHDAEVESEMAELMGELQTEAKAQLAMPGAVERPLPAAPAPAAPAAAAKRIATPMGAFTVESKAKVDQEAEDELAQLQREMGLEG